MQTVREYLASNTDITGVHMMTPYGYVDLSSEQISTLLDNSEIGEISTHFGSSNIGFHISANELLSQVICTEVVTSKDGSTSFLTDDKDRVQRMVEYRERKQHKCS